MNNIVIDDYLKIDIAGKDVFVFSMKVKDLLPIYYVAVRGVDNAPGSVQRVLNKRRISSIKDFILKGNMFYNTFVLNWVNDDYSIGIDGHSLIIPEISAAAQVIDGQHRLEGLKAAIEEKPEIGEQSIIVLLVQHLSTSEAANIFLNINAEQKPVPRSLVYDLFGEVEDKDSYIVRARDIGQRLNIELDSPYYQCIKLPGRSLKNSGRVDLATVVNSIKQYTKIDGLLQQYNIDDLETQYTVVLNFFKSLESFYDETGDWLKTSNPFMTNSGFFAAIDFLCKDLIGKCADRKSFEVKTMKDIMKLDSVDLLTREDLKNLQGKEQRKVVYDYLKKQILQSVPDKNEYKF